MNAQGSPTSGIDGTSEGGRIESLQAEPLLALYGEELIHTLWDMGEQGAMAVRPVKERGRWCIELSVTPEVKSDMPARWYGRRVIVTEVDELAERPYRPGTLGGFTPKGFLGPTQPAHRRAQLTPGPLPAAPQAPPDLVHRAQVGARLNLLARPARRLLGAARCHHRIGRRAAATRREGNEAPPTQPAS